MVIFRNAVVYQTFLTFAPQINKINQVEKKMKKYVIMASLVVGLTGCSNRKVQENEPVRVKVQAVKVQPMQGVQVFSGTIEEMVGSTLSFSVSGTLAQIRVSAGQRVRQGELIASVDDATLQNSHAVAAAALEQAEDAYARMKQLHDNNSLPEMQWTEVQSKLKQARSAEQISKKSLEDSRLYAPFSGVIAAKNVEIGQNVMPGSPVVRLVGVEQVKVSISVPENEISRVAIGQPARIRVSALDNRMFEGNIVEKGIAAHPLSRSYEVKALVRNETGELLPGMICEMELQREQVQEGILLPNHVILLDNENRQFVWVNQSEKASKRYVTVGELGSRGVFITSGLNPGDEVLVEGQQKVSENMDITVEK